MKIHLRLLVTISAGVAHWVAAGTTVFAPNDDEIPAFRIPALVVSPKGTLLAFAEGRQSYNDHSENKITLKRSLNEGVTWGPLQMVHDAGSNVLVNPCAVALASGRILLMYQFFPAAYHSRDMGKRARCLQPGLEGDAVSLTLLRWSDDEGTTWSAPSNVTAQTKRPAAIFTCSGPGVGIQLRHGLHKGRILMPTGDGYAGESHVYACISDDGGRSWRMGMDAPRGEAVSSEVQFAENDDGSVLLNARGSEANSDKVRIVAVSRDGGKSWTPLRADPNLPEPSCMASIISGALMEMAGGCLLFSNPASQTARTNGTIRASYDQGQTWTRSCVVEPGFFSYSSLACLKDGKVGLLYECGQPLRIDFMSMDASALAPDSSAK